MLALIIIFITGVLAMFSSFSKVKNLAKYIGMTGIVVALATILFDRGLGLEFQNFFVFTNSPLAKMMTVLSTGILFFIFLASGENEDYDWSVIVSLMLFSTCGVILLSGLTNLLSLFIGIEVLSIPLYILAAINRKNSRSLEAGLKYFILGAFTSAFLLFGIALVYGTFGLFDMNHIIQYQQMASVELPMFFHVGVLMIMISLMFKMALAPFHFWSPDVYDGSPTIVTAYMSTVVKIGASMAVYYTMDGFFGMQINIWMNYVLIAIATSMLIGSVMGLVQNNVKRIFAYSSISHAAFLMSSLVLVIISQNISFVSLYLVAYTVASLIVFLILNHLTSGGEVSLDDLNGLGSTKPILAFCFTIAVFSMAGLPFTGGFIAKYNILAGLYNVKIYMFILGILASAIGIAYYLKMINRIYFSPSTTSVLPKNSALSCTVIVLTIFIIVLGISPSFALSIFQKFF